MSNIFFIADLHIGHGNILKFEQKFRPFNDLDSMHSHMIKQWNSTIGKRDTVWVLGDIFVTKTHYEKYGHILHAMNGKKNLVLGNHDNLDYEIYYNFFEKVVPMRQYKSGILLTHIPVHPSQNYRYKLNIHGHLHSKKLNGDFYYCVSAEQSDFTPVSLEVIKARRKSNFQTV